MEITKEMVEDYIHNINPDLFLLNMNYISNNSLNIIIDGINGVSIGDCQKITKKIRRDIEEMTSQPLDINLQVSSPGIDSLIVDNRQYQKNIGRSLELFTQQDEKKIIGKLISLNDDSITLQIETKKNNEMIDINLGDIKTSKIIVKF